MDLQPILAKLVAHPQLETAPEKFGNISLQCRDPFRYQELNGSTNIRFVLTDGEYSMPAIYGGPGASLQLFNAGELIELQNWTIRLATGGRPYLHFTKFEPRGVFPVKENQKMTAEIYIKIRTEHNLPLDPKVHEPRPPRPNEATPRNSASDYAAAPTGQTPKYTLISDLSPFIEKFEFRGRCMNKSPIKEFSRNGREGKLFSATFVDESGEIKATAFNDQVDQFYEKLQNGQLYVVSSVKIQAANKKFSNLNNDFEIFLNKETQLTPVADDKSVPEVQYSFVPINEIASRTKDSTVDVCGIITFIDELRKITSRSGVAFDKREIQVGDKSETSITVTLWNKEAEDFNGNVGDPIAIKAARVGEFMNQKQLSTMRTSVITLNPLVREAGYAKGWYDASNGAISFKKVATDDAGEQNGERKRKPMEVHTIKQIEEANDTESYYTIKATVTNVFSRPLYYAACASGHCQKKVNQDTNGDWRCDSCNQSFPEPNYRYILAFTVDDAVASNGLRLSCFDEVATEMLGVPASEVAREKEDGNEEKVNEILDRPKGNEYFFKIKGRLESYNGQEQIRYQVLRLMPLLYTKNCNTLCDELEAVLN